MESGSADCPKCGAEGAVDFDLLNGVSACMACGAVQDEEDLVHASGFDSQGARTGTFVSGGDTGEAAATFSLQATPGVATRRGSSGRGVGEAKLKARVREYGALLRLHPPVVDQALHVMRQAVPRLLGNWPRDNLAAAVTYTACRLNSLPLTLADLSAATQMETHTLGRQYRSVCLLLDLHPPLLLAADLLPRSLDRVTSEALQEGTLTAAQAGAMRRDAAALLDWMQQQVEHTGYPMAAAGAALVLAAEINTVALSTAHVCSRLQLVCSTLETTLREVRTRLVHLAAFLPYASSINSSNVGSHARTIMQLSALVGSTGTDAGSAARGGSSGTACVSTGGAQQQQEAQPQRLPQPEQHAAEQKRGMQQQPAARLQQQVVPGCEAGGGELQRPKRQRVEGEGGQACSPGAAAAARTTTAAGRAHVQQQ